MENFQIRKRNEPIFSWILSVVGKDQGIRRYSCRLRIASQNILHVELKDAPPVEAIATPGDTIGAFVVFLDALCQETSDGFVDLSFSSVSGLPVLSSALWFRTRFSRWEYLDEVKNKKT